MNETATTPTCNPADVRRSFGNTFLAAGKLLIAGTCIAFAYWYAGWNGVGVINGLLFAAAAIKKIERYGFETSSYFSALGAIFFASGMWGVANQYLAKEPAYLVLAASAGVALLFLGWFFKRYADH